VVIITYCYLNEPPSFRQIEEATGVSKSTASHIWRHAIGKAYKAPQQISNPTLTCSPGLRLTSEVPASEGPPAPGSPLLSAPPMASEASLVLGVPLASEAGLVFGAPLFPDAPPASGTPLTSEASGPLPLTAPLAFEVPLACAPPVPSKAPSAFQTLQASEKPPTSVGPAPAILLGGWNGDFTLLELINSKVLDPTPRFSRPKALSVTDKNALV